MSLFELTMYTYKVIISLSLLLILYYIIKEK